MRRARRPIERCPRPPPAWRRGGRLLHGLATAPEMGAFGSGIKPISARLAKRPAVQGILMVGLSQREFEMEAELDELSRRHPLYPRAWDLDVRRRMASTGWDVKDVVLALREEHNLVAPGPVTVASLLECERRYLALFEPDELLDPAGNLPARSPAGCCWGLPLRP